jgi:hypothetical protein
MGGRARRRVGRTATGGKLSRPYAILEGGVAAPVPPLIAASEPLFRALNALAPVAYGARVRWSA